MIKLIIFDLWQTLAYFDVGYSVVNKMLKKTGVSIPRDSFIKIFESSVQTKKWESKFDAYKNLCKNMGIEATEENVGVFVDIRDEAESKTKLYSHTIRMLKQLRKQGYKTGLLSNSSVFAIQQIKKRTNLIDLIDYPLFSYQVGTIKPDLKFYREMLKISNCKPEETIMIGDKLEDDVLPPRKIGMNSILFENYGQLKKELSCFSVKLD